MFFPTYGLNSFNTRHFFDSCYFFVSQLTRVGIRSCHLSHIIFFHFTVLYE